MVMKNPTMIAASVWQINKIHPMVTFPIKPYPTVAITNAGDGLFEKVSILSASLFVHNPFS